MLGSAMLHGGVIALFWASATRAAELPEMRIYSVNIVSPPPTEAGEPAPEVTEPEPEPEPPSEPEPEPSPPPEPTREAEPEPQPEPQEEEPVPTEEAEPEPVEPEPEVPEPEEPQPEEVEEEPEPEPEPARGPEPSAESPGGEGLNVRIEGARFPYPDYLNNIVLQLRRYFRPPAGSRDMAEVIFWINRDGSVSDIRLGRSSGSFQFRLAAMGAVEQAGQDRAFGPLPDGYTADRLPVSFVFEPVR